MFNKLIKLKLSRNFFIAFMLGKTQTLKGITSEVKGEPNKHYIFWEFDNKDLDKITTELQYQQWFYQLGNIYIVSDKENSYRAFCFSKKTFLDMFDILLHTEGLEFSFLWWTMNRCKATLRTHNKIDRQPQQLITVLEGKEKTLIPTKYKRVIYTTGTTKIRSYQYG